MALKGLDIFKMTPKTNCKECGNPTCMAFAMKVAQGSVPMEKCPYITDDVKEKLSEQTAPPMKTIKINDLTLGGETVLERHEKTFVSKTLYAVKQCTGQSDEANEKALATAKKVDYERIGERMFAELLFVNYVADKGEERYYELVKTAAASGRDIILSCADEGVAEKALELLGGKKVILDGAKAENFEKMNEIAKKYGAVLAVQGKDLDEIHDTVEKLEKLGNKELIIDVGWASIKEAFKNCVEIRRSAIKGGDRTFGYPTIVNVSRLARGDKYMQASLAALFTAKYGSILVMDEIDYDKALPLYGLRQNIFTNPQKPMKVEPGIYRINGADENSICMTTVDFALTYFVVSGEVERSGVPVNLLISDAGGYSVLTAWAAGKLSASSIAKFMEEFQIEEKIKNRVLVLPGKVAVLKGEIQEKLPNWKVVVGTSEAIELVKFLKEYK